LRATSLSLYGYAGIMAALKEAAITLSASPEEKSPERVTTWELTMTNNQERT